MDGKGKAMIFPPLAGNAIVRQASAESLARVVLAGTQAAADQSCAHRGRRCRPSPGGSTTRKSPIF